MWRVYWACVLQEKMNQRLVTDEKSQLLFSKKPRRRSYQPYTLQDFKRIQPKKYLELGSLQPNLTTKEHKAKVAKAEKVKQYAERQRALNAERLMRRNKAKARQRKQDWGDVEAAKQRSSNHNNAQRGQHGSQYEDHSGPTSKPGHSRGDSAGSDGQGYTRQVRALVVAAGSRQPTTPSSHVVASWACRRSLADERTRSPQMRAPWVPAAVPARRRAVAATGPVHRSSERPASRSLVDPDMAAASRPTRTRWHLRTRACGRAA